MSKTASIAALVLLAIAGAWLGRQLPPAHPTLAEEETSPTPEQPTRPAGETLDLLTAAESESARYDLRSGLEVLPFDHLGDLFASLAKEDQGIDQVSVLLRIMMSRDGHATKDTDDPGMHIHNATTGFLHQWAQRDPRAALEAWMALPEPKLANKSSIPYSAECLARGASGDPEMRQVALAMLMEQPASESRTNAVAGALARWAADSPLDEIGSWLEQQDLSGAAKNTAAVTAATTAAQNGDAAAADWLREQVYANQEFEVDRSNHLDTFVEEWAREDPDAAAGWLTSLPPGRVTDWAIRGLLRQLEYIDAAAGFQWTRQVTHEGRREAWAAELWNGWRRVAPEAARAFVPDLTPAEQQRLRIGG